MTVEKVTLHGTICSDFSYEWDSIRDCQLDLITFMPVKLKNRGFYEESMYIFAFIHSTFPRPPCKTVECASKIAFNYLSMVVKLKLHSSLKKYAESSCGLTKHRACPLITTTGKLPLNPLYSASNSHSPNTGITSPV